MNTVNRFLTDSSKADPEKLALIDDDSKFTFSQLEEKVIKFSSFLNQFKEKSVISILFENTSEFVISYLGIINSGCVAHLIPTGISQSNLQNQISSAQPKLILSSNSYFNQIDDIELENLEKLKFSDVKEISSKNKTPSPTDYAYLIYTSGTTSTPKGVPITHSSCIFSTKNIAKTLHYSKNDVDLLPLQMSHSFGLGCLHTSLYVGSTLVLQKNSKPTDILESIKKHNITTLAAIPSTLSNITSNITDDSINPLSNLRLIITNSTFFPPETIKKLRSILKNGIVATYYGLTEASRSTFMIFNDEKKIESVGKPSDGVQIKIKNENNDGIGEILIRGPNIIDNYWKNEYSENKSDDWLRTGDLGKFDEDGFLYIMGRVDDLINISGEKVYPQEIERIVKVLSGIEEVVAIPMKHKSFGEVVKLFVKKTIDSEITSMDIITHCINNMERFKVPAKIEFVEDFPRTDYGKIKRFMLKE
jgi:long-chain acyl-CoA synthetase